MQKRFYQHREDTHTKYPKKTKQKKNTKQRNKKYNKQTKTQTKTQRKTQKELKTQSSQENKKSFREGGLGNPGHACNIECSELPQKLENFFLAGP